MPNTPAWVNPLIKEVSSINKKLDNLEKQTLVYSSKLTALSKDTKKISKELPLIRMKIGFLRVATANINTHIKRLEKKVDKLT